MTKSRVKLPTFNRVLVKPLPSDASSVIHIEDRSALVRGEIVAAGPMAGVRDKIHHHSFLPGLIVTYDRTKALEVIGTEPGTKLHLMVDDTIFLVE